MASLSLNSLQRTSMLRLRNVDIGPAPSSFSHKLLHASFRECIVKVKLRWALGRLYVKRVKTCHDRRAAFKFNASIGVVTAVSTRGCAFPRVSYLAYVPVKKRYIDRRRSMSCPQECKKQFIHETNVISRPPPDGNKNKPNDSSNDLRLVFKREFVGLRTLLIKRRTKRLVSR